MASTKKYTIDLGLPEHPLADSSVADIYPALQAIYATIQMLAEQLDLASGLVSESELITKSPTADARDTTIYNRLSRIYAIAGEDLTYGNLIEIRADGKAYKNTQKIYSTQYTTLIYAPVLGFLDVDAVTAGDTAVIATKGILAAAALQISTAYWAAAVYGNQFAGQIVSSQNSQLDMSRVGTAVKTDGIWFDGTSA